MDTSILFSTWTAIASFLVSAFAVPVELQQQRLNHVRKPAVVASNGHTVTLDSGAYYLPGKPEISFVVDHGEYPLASTNHGYLPISVIATNSSRVSINEYRETVGRFVATDDVWSASFLEAIIFKTAALSTEMLEEALASALARQNVLSFSSFELSTTLTSLSEGPYFLSAQNNLWSIYKAYKMHADFNSAFVYGVIEDQDGGYKVLPATHTASDGSATLAVPSRLYYSAPTAELPLNGVRIGVKDLFNIKGLKTSMGSRAWFSLYEAANETAPAIQRLVELGGVIIGKTRLSQFANGEDPTSDYVDYHAPFNPRADGYQDPSCSSSGAGSAQASYDWVDMNIGSDTGGSVRAPAAVSGVFGNRPSQGAITIAGALSLAPEMDTAGFMARSAVSFAAWGKSWYVGLNLTEYPSPGFFPSENVEAQALYDTFVTKLESFLETKKIPFDFYTQYKETSGTGLYPPAHVSDIWSKLTTYHQSRTVYPQLRGDWAATHRGDHPPLDPAIRRNFEFGLTITPKERDYLVAAKNIFQDWTRSKLLPANHSSPSCSDLLINPLSPGAPSSRSSYTHQGPTKDNVYFGFNRYGISQLAGLPEVVVPIGSLSFRSEVTESIKKIPVAVGLVAGWGCDFMLFDLIKRLAEEGIIREEVRTGSEM